ncbi:Trypsin-4 [Pseudolycoriella hygida]|uniref:Trypsin-4 n=1 Tax=Pseudolycoriella hygida TaxID=35572 RepID=A0A9Q0N7U1_9DIPT|nr:Trypsin-4 [Pseudolycoriella hygida]
MWKVVILICVSMCHYSTTNNVTANSDRNLLIVNGTVITINERPYQVALNFHYIPFIYADFVCGGVIIGKKWILTAAHCLDKAKVVRAGTSCSTWWGKMFNMKETYVHPNYTRVPLRNDVAILELDEDIEYSDEIQPIEMMTGLEKIPDNEDDYEIVVSGYGLPSFKSKEEDCGLKKIVVKTISRDECKQHYKTLLDNQICAINKTSSTCQGDSGGPLTMTAWDNGKIKLFLMGISSFGDDCKVNEPMVFSYIPSFLGWIKYITKL